MPRPGVNVLSRATPPSRGTPTDTGVSFAAGLADEGPAGVAIQVRNLGEFIAKFGPRVSYALGYDCVETFFREGGTTLFFTRIVGPAATKATKTINDRAGAPLPTIKVDAIGPGTYGATISVAVIAGTGANQYKMQITRGGVVVETSGDLNTPTDAVNWSQGSAYVRITDLASASVAPTNIPAVTAVTPLVGGNDDRGAIVDATKVAALAAFTPELGTGQVWVCGGTTAAVQTGLRVHALANNREALLDMPDTPTAATMTALTVGLNDDYGMAFGPWIQIPGLVPNTVRNVPPAPFVAALMARNDAVNGPNDPAAGGHGTAQWALGVTQTYTDADRELLNNAGVNIIRNIFGVVELYGYRTLVDPNGAKAGWIAGSNQRMRLQMTARGQKLGEGFEFAKVDGRRKKLTEWGGALAGMLHEYYNNGDLYGETADDAYAVDVGPQVNTPATLTALEIHAVLTVKMSPFAEAVYIEIVKVGLSESV